MFVDLLLDPTGLLQMIWREFVLYVSVLSYVVRHYVRTLDGAHLERENKYVKESEDLDTVRRKSCILEN